MNEEQDLSTNTCPKCQATSEEVLNIETRKRVGWYCLNCHYFEQAILRETVITAEDIKKIRI